jgi:hypothetical protein
VVRCGRRTSGRAGQSPTAARPLHRSRNPCRRSGISVPEPPKRARLGSSSTISTGGAPASSSRTGNNPECVSPRRNRVARPPVGHRALERRRLSGIAVHRLEPEQKPCHSVLRSVVGWGRTAGRAYDKSGAQDQTHRGIWSTGRARVCGLGVGPVPVLLPTPADAAALGDRPSRLSLTG